MAVGNLDDVLSVIHHVFSNSLEPASSASFGSIPATSSQVTSTQTQEMASTGDLEWNTTSSSSDDEDELRVEQASSQPQAEAGLAEAVDTLMVDDDMPILLTSLDNEMGKTLHSILECPVCFEYMTPPIGLCESGHSSCQKCRPQMETCPICRSKFIDTRNMALEGIARRLRYPCRNRKAGCDEKYPMELINEHQAVCPRRKYPCPIEPCVWSGRRNEILSHVWENHPANAWKENKISFVYTNFEGSNFTDVIDTLGEIFILHRRYDEQKGHMYAVVQYVGPSENAGRYKYEFEFLSLGELKSVMFKNLTQSDTLQVDDIFQSGNCVILGIDVMFNLVKDAELWCCLGILPVEE